MRNSILNYYGLTYLDGISYQSYQSEYVTPVEDTILKIELADIKDTNNLVLLISIRAKTFVERKMHISDLLTQRFGLYCDVLLEQQIKTFDSLVRICAVVVRFNQLPLLLKTLFEQSSYSFAIIAGTQEPSYFWSQLIDSFENGLLTPKAIKACANKALINNASFLHILRGNDGYSINYFSKK